MANNIKLTILFFCITFISFCPINGQVTIGSGIPPRNGSLLELKEFAPIDPLTDNSTAKKGILFPRVRLANHNNLFPMFEDDGNGGYKIGSTPYSKADEDLSHIGLIVYNLDETIFSVGLHFWTGSEWRRLDGSSPAHAQIGTLICTSEYMVPNRLTNGQPFDGIMKIPYTGGNGGAYPSTAPVSIGNGLWMERIGGVLALGEGEVAYHIFTQAGTPVSGLPASNTVSFQLPQFLNLPAGCYVTIGEDVEVKAIQFIRKTVDLNSNTTTNSEITFGSLKLRLKYSGSGNLAYPEYTMADGINCNILVLYKKTGYSGNLYSRYQTNPTRSLTTGGTWYDFGSGTSAGDSKDINIDHRDFGEAWFMLTHNNIREMYRVTYNVYKAISATGTSGQSDYIPAVSASCTIFVEKLD